MGHYLREVYYGSVTVYVDGWIVGIESSITWRVIEEASDKEPGGSGGEKCVTRQGAALFCTGKVRASADIRFRWW